MNGACRWLAFMTVISVSVSCVGQINDDVDSFESVVPREWTCEGDGGGKLSVSDSHYKAGVHSLQWDWNSPEGFIEVRKEIGNVLTANKQRAERTFAAWIYNEKPLPNKKLRFEFGSEETVNCSFDFQLNFRGWRLAFLTYQRDMNGDARNDMEFMRIRPPQRVPAGTLFFDGVVMNMKFDYRFHARDYQLPDANVYLNNKLMWQSQLFTEQLAEPDDLLWEVTSDERAALEKFEEFYSRDSNKPVSQKEFVEARKRFESWKLSKADGQIRGIPLRFRFKNIYAGEFKTLADFTKDLHGIILLSRRPFNRKTDEQEIRRMILLALEHIEDQGVAQGSGYGTLDHFAYHCRMYVPCLFQAREILQEEGLLKRYNDAAAWFYCRKRVFDELDATGGDLDDFNTMTVPRFLTILMMQNEQRRVGYLRYFSRKFSKLLLPGTSTGFHADGSAHHHEMHYPIYMFGATKSITPLIRLLGSSPFRISEEAHSNFNKAMLLGRVWSNKLHWPISLSGRHPNGDRTIEPEQYFDLALAGSPDGKHEIDPVMAAAYLRLVDQKGDNARLLIEKGFEAEPNPNGTWVMNHAPSLLIHRHDNWSATMRGLSSYYPSTELYTRENRFGRYQANGHLEILNHDGNFGSGFRMDGWDWNHFPGTTSVYLPLKELESPTKSSVYVKNSSPFSGAVHFDGQHGLWAMDMQELSTHTPGFVGRKSAFFFGDRIICLGSAIRCDDSTNPCVTTLFQKHLPATDHETNVNGKSITSLPFQHQSPDESISLTDGFGNGYYVPKNQQLHVERRTQTSRDEDDIRTTTGDFVVAWISHGAKPEDGGYEYAMLPAGADRIDDFADQMKSIQGAPYRVLRRDAKAHIVHDLKTGIHAAAFFEPQIDPQDDELAVERPCLLMYRADTSGKRVEVAICDPDLRFENGEFVTRKLRFTVNGEWQTTSADIAPSFANGRTAVSIECRAGATYSFILNRK